MNTRRLHVGLFLAVIIPLVVLQAADVLSPKDVLMMKRVSSAVISPNGDWIAYTVSVPREATDRAGSSYNELYLISARTKEVRPFITGKENVSSVAWRPDGSAISFVAARGEGAAPQVWMIPTNGGEAVQLTKAETGVLSFAWNPLGDKVGYVSTTPRAARDKKLESLGYGFLYFEEDLKHRNLFIADVGRSSLSGQPQQLTKDISVWSFVFAPDGKSIALAASPRNHIDDSYMFQRIHLLDLESKSLKQLTNNPGKLGNYLFSPDGKTLAYTSALDRKDHAFSQACVISVIGGNAKNLTPPKFRGHVRWVEWKDANTLLYGAAEGTANTISSVSITGGERKIVLTSQESGLVFDQPTFSRSVESASFVGNTVEFPGDLFLLNVGTGDAERLTKLNPWLADRQLGKQELMRYRSRDGVEIEGLLIYPTGYTKGATYPLITVVHGGPEANYANGWLTSYSEPGQVLAGKGYIVFYPNYRSSTGYGVEFAAAGYMDPAGKEFDDIADGIERLIKQGIADKNRVGLGGGSYGGYASAWFATYYTKMVKAVCMFVGISDLISKRGSTDIAYEELYVHSGKPLEQMWDLALKRSPLYYAHQSRTATLIMGGGADPRVHPTQSIELYRQMKMSNHPAVRLVQYPGEGHGNARQPGRIDVLYRILDWYDWYVKDAKPLNGPMPPLDLSDKYGLSLPE
jgi:dipeptidyl aminopeptidase/acylaminoacyl peptidase